VDFARSAFGVRCVFASLSLCIDITGLIYERPLPGLGAVLYPITGGLHHRLIFNIPPGLVSAPPKK